MINRLSVMGADRSLSPPFMNFRRLIRKMYEKGISDDYLSYYTDRVKSELSSFLLKRIKICQSIQLLKYY
jgi:histone H3/H4